MAKKTTTIHKRGFLLKKSYSSLGLCENHITNKTNVLILNYLLIIQISHLSCQFTKRKKNKEKEKN